MSKKIIIEILLCISTGALAILSFCMVTCIWNMDLSVPLSYAGDLSGLLVNIKAVLRDEAWWKFDGLGAPFGTNMWRQLMDGMLPNVFMYSFAKLTNSIGYGINLYYILSYGLSAICSYYMLRKAGLQRKYSMIGGVIYALIPGHFLRGEQHIYVGSCFAIPLFVVMAINLAEGRMCKRCYIQKDKLTFKELVQSNSKEHYVGMFFLALVTFCTLYYGVFALMILTFCTVYNVVNSKKVRSIYYYFQYCLLEVLCLALIYLPQLLANRLDPVMEKVDIITRSMGDTEWYAGKLVQYLFPVSNHRISFLAELRQKYDLAFPLVNENSSATLGAIMAVGFIVGLLVCFFQSEKFAGKIETYGKIELFCFFVSTIGGLGAIVGLINYNLRCYNRFSYFIGAFAIVISMKLLQEFVEWINKRSNNVVLRQVERWIICVSVLLFGILDQTTEQMVYTAEFGDAIALQYQRDEEFVKKIEKYEGTDANILVFPIMNGQQAAIAYTNEGIFTNYKERMLFLHSSTSNWSIGSRAGEQAERWLDWFGNIDTSKQIEIAALVDFSGIAVCHAGYSDEMLEKVILSIENLLGQPAVIHEDGGWTYYSISNMKNSLLNNYTDDEKKEMSSRYLYEFADWYRYSINGKMCTTSGIVADDNSVVLTYDTWQYGPYDNYSKGWYEVAVYGEGLLNATFDCVTRGMPYNMVFLEQSDKVVRYYVIFEKDAEFVEFRTHNLSDKEVRVSHIDVHRLQDFFTKEIEEIKR